MKEAGLRLRNSVLDRDLPPAHDAKPIIEKLTEAVAKAMREDGVVRRLAEVGTEAVGSSAGELDALTRQQFELYRGIVQDDKSLLGAQ